ncbi:hypothetical protein HPB47_017140 [Ixodes persulcatus]|uniref:Uncharacterized protein n=1 Tax=Ixodes persulcatus TaxID=34615 RepID=A0AC60QP31_IXOPE|nr:hypothetical protein HPB47_017140 [Ixodes persulcatus]
MLRFYNAGTFQVVTGDLVNVSQPTVCCAVGVVTQLIARHLLRDFIHFPSAAQFGTVMRDFYALAHSTGVSGRIDCTPVQIKSPGGNDTEVFRNRKEVFSINVQIGLQLEFSLVSQGVIVSPAVKEENDRIQAARVAFSQINHDCERLNKDFLSCSQEVYEASKEKPDLKYITELQAASIKARQKLRKEHFLGEGHPDTVNDRLKLNHEECVAEINKSWSSMSRQIPS